MRLWEEKGLTTVEAALILPMLLLVLIFLIGGFRGAYLRIIPEEEEVEKGPTSLLLPAEVIRGTDLALDLGDQLRPWLPKWIL